MFFNEVHPTTKVRSVGVMELHKRAAAAEEKDGLKRSKTPTKGNSTNEWYHGGMCVGRTSREERFRDSQADAVVHSSGPLKSSCSGPHPTKGRPGCLPAYASQESQAEESNLSFKDLPRFLAKISVIILAVAAVVDLSFSQSGRSYLFDSSASAKRAALGSAAIRSVTETLSPILPFTGGIDLRKEDYWMASSPLESIRSIATYAWEAFTVSNLLDTPTASITKANDSVAKTSSIKISHSLSVSSTSCFSHPDDISELTLEDVSRVIRYAIDANRPDFDEQRFLGRQLPRVRKVLLAMKEAVQSSRGNCVQISKISGMEPRDPAASGLTDALMFAAAMRIFGEWRVVRQVPEGYKGYAVGMQLGHKDIVQNVAKVELAVHNWLDTVDTPEDGILRSPTIAELMKYEAESGVHPSLPRLKDRTGAMGLLWVRRQLQYQTQIFANVLTRQYTSTTAAVTAAYDKVYNQYHGWAVQKIFTYSFQAAPEADAIFRHMNPHKLKELREGKISVSVLKTDELANNDLNKSDGGEDENPVAVWFKNFEKQLDNNPVVMWFKEVGDNSRRLVEDICGKFLHENSEANSESNGGSVVEQYISSEMTKNALENIQAYLEVARPLLEDLASVFEQFNMNDPTKV